MPTGKLVVSSGVSSINGTNLARQNEPNPLAAATNFIAESGFSPGNLIRVEGSSGSISSGPVFFITSVRAGLGAAKLAGRRKKPAKKAAKKSSKKSAKKPAKKKAAKKSTKKQARKSAKKKRHSR